MRRHAVQRPTSALFLVRHGANDVAARLLVALEREDAAPLGFFEQSVERTKPVVRLGEAGPPALECLLHHRAPDLLFRATLGDQGFDRAGDEIDRLVSPLLL